MAERGPMPTVLLIGDSFGIQRVHDDNVDVPVERTWPRQVARSATVARVDVDFVPYRRFIEVPALIAHRPMADVTIVQAGVVDCYPRPLPLEVSMSQTLVARFVRRTLIRPIRRPWMTHVYRTTWSSRAEIDEAFVAFAGLAADRRIGFITVTPALRKHAAITPLGDEAIAAFNQRLHEFTRSNSNAFLIDAHAGVVADGYPDLLSPIDGHLSQRGNDWLAERMLGELARELRLDLTMSTNDA